MLFSEVARAFQFGVTWEISPPPRRGIVLKKKSHCPKAGAGVAPGEVWLLLESADA